MRATADPVIDWLPGDEIIAGRGLYMPGDMLMNPSTMEKFDVLAWLPGDFVHVRPRPADVT